MVVVDADVLSESDVVLIGQDLDSAATLGHDG
jgi:hypothetical protein